MKDKEIVNKLKKVKVAHNRIGEGEVTGHAHRVDVGDFAIYTDSDTDNSDRLLEVSSECTLTHEEHGVITLPEGIYVVTTQRTVDPLADEIQRVRD